MIVVLAARKMPVREVVELTIGAIIELPKQADEELEILVNNKVIGTGKAVKVGENFGIRLSFVGELRDRVAAMGPDQTDGDAAPPAADDVAAEQSTADADALAEAMLAGQS